MIVLIIYAINNINLYGMNKNINSGAKSWKSSQEGHKPTNSMIIENVVKYVNPHPTVVVVPITIPGKNVKYHECPKVSTFQRHYSQQYFKKPIINIENNFVQMPSKVQDEYFPESGSPGFKIGKKVHSIQKNTKQIPTKPSFIEKTMANNFNLRLNGLKETSSTQSADNLGVHRSAPAFVKSKLFKQQSGKFNQYYYHQHQVHTPRNNVKRENFKIISKLGQGKFGKVFLVKEIYTGIILAMKIVQKKKIISQNLLQQFVRELRIQSYLNHPNIISLYGFFCDQTHFYTLMELGCDGQLYSLILNRRILTEEATSFIIKNLLEAIQYIHLNKVLHRDIKPQNIVLIMGNVKICDFGWAVNKLHPGDLRNTFCGTPLYLSPQILQGSRYDQKVDLWAIGILAFQLYLGCSPFQINDQSDLFKIATQCVKFPQDREVSQQFKEFIFAMLTKNPNQRLTSKKLLQMDFITKYRDFQTCEELCK